MILFPHQQNIIDYLIKNNTRAALIFHAIGSGKTITAIAYCDKKLETAKQIFLIMLKSLADNFKNEMNIYFKDKLRYKTMLDKLVRIDTNNIKDIIFTNSIIIIDESQLLINGIIHKDPNFLLVYEKIMKEPDLNLLMLSGTPLKEYVFEFSPMFNMILREEFFSRNSKDFCDKYFDSIIPNAIFRSGEFIRKIHKYVSYFDGYLNNVEFMAKLLRHKLILVPLGKIQNTHYSQETDNDKKFKICDYIYTKTDDIELYSSKIPKLYNIIITENIKECGVICIYCEYREMIEMLSRYLKAHDFYEYEKNNNHDYKNFCIIHNKNFIDYQKIYNNPENRDGKNIKIIIFSIDLSYGISIFYVRYFHIMNIKKIFSEYNQILGRVRRVYSHKLFEKKDRTIQYYIYITTYDNGNYTIENIIYEASVYFQKFIEPVQECMKVYNIENIKKFPSIL